MLEYSVVALSQRVADEVRGTLRAPVYGHPAHVEVAKGYGPCRLCLRPFRTGQEERLLFTFNPFPTDAELPSPGPIFVHRAGCERYDAPGFPDGLLGLPLTLEGYDARGFVRARIRLAGEPGAAIDAVFAAGEVDYAHIRNTEAGCFVARVERSRPGRARRRRTCPASDAG